MRKQLVRCERECCFSCPLIRISLIVFSAFDVAATDLCSDNWPHRHAHVATSFIVVSDLHYMCTSIVLCRFVKVAIFIYDINLPMSGSAVNVNCFHERHPLMSHTYLRQPYDVTYHERMAGNKSLNLIQWKTFLISWLCSESWRNCKRYARFCVATQCFLLWYFELLWQIVVGRRSRRFRG